MNNKTEIILELAEQIENFPLSSSDDTDVETAVIYSFKHLVKRFLGHARKIQHQGFQGAITQINVNLVESIYDAYDLHSDLQVIVDELKELMSKPSTEWMVLQTEYIDSSVIEVLNKIKNQKYDLSKVIQFCEEINGAFSSGYFLSTSLLIRALLNHIPPIFGQKTFAQVVAQSSKSRKELFKPLEEVARGVADLHTHDTIRHKESLPTRKQLEVFQPSIEILLQEIVAELQKPE